MIKVIKQWTSKVILIALMLIAIEVPPMAVNFALRYSKTNQLIVDGFMALFIGLMLAIIWWDTGHMKLITN